MTKQTNEERACKTPHADLCDSALANYERVASIACDWSGTIVEAIKFYKQYGDIPQPEQLEVYLNGGLGINGAAYAVDYINTHGDPMCLLWAKSKQEALDFCAKHNLKVTNEPEGGVK